MAYNIVRAADTLLVCVCHVTCYGYCISLCTQARRMLVSGWRSCMVCCTSTLQAYWQRLLTWTQTRKRQGLLCLLLEEGGSERVERWFQRMMSWQWQ